MGSRVSTRARPHAVRRCCTDARVARLVLVFLLTPLIIAPIAAQGAWEFGSTALVFDREYHMMDSAVASDGLGGMLVVAADQDPIPRRVLVSRIDHTGTEAWGDGGRWLPFEIGASWDSWPVAITHDGAGGAYVAFRTGFEGYDLLYVAHVMASGSFDWRMALDNLGTPGSDPAPAVRLVPADSGEVIVTWIQYTPALQLYAARVGAAGSIVWHGPVNTSFGTSTTWEAISDGGGGALIAFARGNPGTTEVRIQRMAGTNGARLFGNDGTLLWTNLGGDHAIAGDGSGGAYVVTSSVGQAWGQHVNNSGAITWAAGGLMLHDSHTLYYALSTLPRVCTDGAGGFILLHGIETLFAQRFGASGSPLWSAVTVAASVAPGLERVLDADGFGGAIVGYANRWLIGSNVYCKELWSQRLDAFGARPWEKLIEYCEFVWGPGGSPILQHSPHRLTVVADGSGGAMAAWMRYSESANADLQMWALGVDAQGQEPTARLTLLMPDAGAPGEVGPYIIFGDYLDLNLQYALRHHTLGSTLALTPTVLSGYKSVGGTGDLTGVDRGPHHLTVADNGAPRDTLRFAFGVGDRADCDNDQPLVELRRAIDIDGSPRQTAYAPDGTLHTVWVEYEASTLTYSLVHRQDQGSGWEPRNVLAQDTHRLKHPALAVDASGTVHASCVIEQAVGDHRVAYYRWSQSGGLEFSDIVANFRENSYPVVVATAGAVVHIIFQSPTGTGDELLDRIYERGAGVGPVLVTSGRYPRRPDAASMGWDVALLFARNSVIPGIAELDFQIYTGGVWQPETPLNYSLAINSPSVAAWGPERVLCAWIADNEALNGIPPTVYTTLRDGGTFGEIRIRPGALQHHAVTVGCGGAERFYMLTQESAGGPQMALFLRSGEGNAFYPRLQVNTNTDVESPRLAISPAGGNIFAYWRDYLQATTPLWSIACSAVATGVAGRANSAAPETAITVNPNPLIGSTTLSLAVPHRTYVKVRIYDARGRLVRTLLEQALEPGLHRVAWDGREATGSAVASGVYYARMEGGRGEDAIARIVVVR